MLREVRLISQGVLIDHVATKSVGAPDAEVFASLLTRELSEIELFDWVRKQFGWEFALFQLYRFQHEHPDFAFDRGPGVTVSPEDEHICCWPECGERERLDKDHILPRSALRAGELGIFLSPYQRRFEHWNGQYLCAQHNRYAKGNSIGIGLAFLMAKIEGG